MTRVKPVRILQIGAGHFGAAHLDAWQKLAEQGEVELKGIVVADATKSRPFLPDVPLLDSLDAVNFSGVDAVDIVTPAATHAGIIRQCLPHADVLVEKPLVVSPADARGLQALADYHGRRLMVGHIYRFHPMVGELRRLIGEMRAAPPSIFGVFLNPAGECPGDADPAAEMLHWFDVLDDLFGVRPDLVSAMRQDNTSLVSLLYPGPMSVSLRLGWQGDERVRTLDFLYPKRSIQCDFEDNSITLDEDGGTNRLLFPRHMALEAELRSFVRSVRDRTPVPVDAATGTRILEIADAARPRLQRSKPRVAVLGGGIFGVTCASALGDFCDVTLFERHEDLLGEASSLNQWRYHHGFHYPRSIEMIREIQECRQEFEAAYGDAIEPDVVSYYAVARGGRTITKERYLHICSAMDLEFTEALPPPGILDSSKISLCLKTGESVFSADRLRMLMDRRLGTQPNIVVARATEVVGAELLSDGRKRLAFNDGGRRKSDDFDYVVNATYANRNILAEWLNFPIKPLRFDLLELLVLEVPMPKISVTILDGPFTSLVSMAEPNRFSLSHIQQSVHLSATPKDGLPPLWAKPASNRDNLMRHAMRYLPVLAEAKVVDSRFGTRTVPAAPGDVDGRPTVVTYHGFGCWSVLGGKVNTSVSNARQIARVIADQHGIDHIGALAEEAAVSSDADDWRGSLPMGAQRR